MLFVCLLLGTVCGALVNYYGLGFCGSVACTIKRTNTYGFRTFLISILVSGIGIYIFKSFSNGKYDYIGVMGIDLPLFLGAFIFGIGMILSDGCVLGMVRDLGRGYVYHVFTFLFVIIGTLVGNLTYRDWWLGMKEKAVFIYMPDTYGSVVGLIIFLIVVLSAYAGFYIWTIKPDTKDSSEANENKLPKKNIIGGILLGLFLIAYEVIYKNNLGISGAFPFYGAWIAKLFGADPTKWSFFDIESSKDTINSGILAFDTSYIILGIILGSMAVSLIQKNFKIHKITSIKQVISASVGGFLMGYGTCMAGSCSLAGFLTSASNLSVSAWIYMIAMLLGGAVVILFKTKKVNNTTYNP